MQVTPVPVPRLGPKQNVVRVLSHNLHSLLSQVQLHCSNDVASSLPLAAHYLPQVPLSRHNALSAHILDVDLPRLELIPLITSGPAENRVDLAFFADGYTAGERQKFLDDASRLARDLVTNQTFFTVRPLLNIWVVFTPSKESGVGVGGKAKDTPFGLYRDGTELRGLYANNSDVALAACASLGDKCDYAILLANDPLYGGIGGEYTTTTASLANGALVLRHEIGHSIIEVGEEYDGGFAYFGVNALHDPKNVTWAHWLTDEMRVERSVMPMQAYPWTFLDVEKPWSFTFSSSGTYARHLVKFSLSGIPRADDLLVSLDGVNLGWAPRKDIGIDRWHYDIFGHALLEGEHVIEFALRNRELQGQAQLCSVEVLEYGADSFRFNASRGYYSLFPTYDQDNGTSYRPTNDDCLMRTVARPNFCNVCREGLWLSLLKRIDLIEGFRMTCLNANSRVVSVDLVKLAQFREHPVEIAESYAITWSRNGRILEEFTNLTEVDLGAADATYRVDVTYAVEEVRLDPRGYLRASRTFNSIPHSCWWW
ncbi:IgA peptidase M64-domain-containing protein [Boletus edulis BED1]|uniref:IgA peptidase M64-domain-containing protein n=1 Tax=Boletus edulis BED1 TaxID=1328754 RepID=A0AAD4BVD4_BOLED|nr:IgA peptidase M64-domain-containing protein [Boletus edulis BED1]